MSFFKRICIFLFIIFCTLNVICLAKSAEIIQMPNHIFENMEEEKIDTSGLMIDSQPLRINNMYFQFDNSMRFVPTRYFSDGYTNSPLYVYDSSFHLINTVEYDDYLLNFFYEDGYYYYMIRKYVDGKDIHSYYKATLYTLDDAEQISSEEYLLSAHQGKICDNLKYSSMAKYNFDRYGKGYSDDRIDFIIDPLGVTRRINRENNGSVSSLETSYLGDECVITWREKNTDNSEQFRHFLSLDGVTPFEMPEDISEEKIAKDADYLYIGIEDNEEYCYRIPLSELIGHVKVAINGVYLSFEQPPVVEDGRTLVPMRFLFECLGDKVTWDEETRSVTAENKNSAVTFSLDSLTADVNGTEQTMDVPAKLIGDKTYVPLRFLSENLGYTVTWDEETSTAKIAVDSQKVSNYALTQATNVTCSINGLWTESYAIGGNLYIPVDVLQNYGFDVTKENNVYKVELNASKEKIGDFMNQGKMKGYMPVYSNTQNPVLINGNMANTYSVSGLLVVQADELLALGSGGYNPETRCFEIQIP